MPVSVLTLSKIAHTRPTSRLSRNAQRGPNKGARLNANERFIKLASQSRLARALLLLANFGKESQPEPVIAKVTQETLAEMIGTTRSRVSHFMNKFRKLGLIEYNGHLEIHRSLLNVVLHEDPHINR